MPELDHKSLHWFHLCNCSSFHAKMEFYAFKTRFLHRFATPAGWDLQIISYPCWTCDGTGLYSVGHRCFDCAGSGIFRINEIWLQRWDLCGQIYHIPVRGEYEPHPDTTPVTEFQGLIKHHSDHTQSAARRCFYRLLLRYEPTNFWLYMVARIKTHWICCRTAWIFRLVKLRNKLDLFPCIGKTDDIPF